ncbi:N-6 DNA methylase [Nocardioides marmorisolisilvae]|uniref:N-6 DNA methylase n=1 Tax=Nocardioides marmorisolisilvae TaxID=1542737 RepID=UPI00161144A8|nr:N-6 DNA methylase [Nocardioides marmorisolisilvae]
MAVSGSENKPLFDRAEVVLWLQERGHAIAEESGGERIWSVLNSIRHLAPPYDLGDLVLLLATLRAAYPAGFEQVATAGLDNLSDRLERAVATLQNVEGLRGVEIPPTSVPMNDPNVARLVRAIAELEERKLPVAVDFVLERLARWQIKGGADTGFVGSRTSKLLSSLGLMIPAGTVYDPACGIANVLTSIGTINGGLRLVGSEINREALGVASQRAYLRNLNIDLVLGDVLATDPTPGLLADIVLAEPPFGMSWDPTAKVADPRFAFGVPPKVAADLAWVQHAIAHLTPEGRGFILTAPGALFRSGVERHVRMNLLSAGCIEAVVGLPSKMLPHTSVGPALWVVRPPRAARDVLLIDASEVRDVEDEVAGWLNSEGAVAIEVPHAVVPVRELLAADAVLAPVNWIAAAAPDSAAIAASFTDASGKMAQAINWISNSSLAFEQLANLPKPRMATVQELIGNGVVELRPGRPDKSREVGELAAKRIARASDVKSRRLPSIDDLPAFDHRDLTEEGDVLVTSMNEIRALVDETGGHLPSTGVDRLRILDRAVLGPHYLASVITGSWNARLQSGTTIQRAKVRDLEIPLIPVEDQAKVALARVAVGLIQEHAAALNAHATEVNDAILNALRYNVPLDTSDFVGAFSVRSRQLEDK